MECELEKSNTHAFSGKRPTHHKLILDISGAGSLQGTFEYGGTMIEKLPNLGSANDMPEVALAMKQQEARLQEEAARDKENNGDLLLSALLQHMGKEEGRKYHRSFIENEVDWDGIQLMEQQHFKELGIPIGPRLKISNAIKQAKQDRKINASIRMFLSQISPNVDASGGIGGKGSFEATSSESVPSYSAPHPAGNFPGGLQPPGGPSVMQNLEKKR